MEVQMKPKRIVPSSPEWPLFLDMSYTYMLENWPVKIQEKSKEVFSSDYTSNIRKRIEQGPRGLFLYYKFEKPVALSNAYISLEDNEKVLNVAEFYVIPSNRKQGLGSQMLNHLIDWGKEESATKLKIEVDKDLEGANHFWEKFGYQLDDSGSRNLYFTQI